MVAEWCKNGYVVHEVWERVRDLVSFELPTGVKSTERPPVAGVSNESKTTAKC